VVVGFIQVWVVGTYFGLFHIFISTICLKQMARNLCNIFVTFLFSELHFGLYLFLHVIQCIDDGVLLRAMSLLTFCFLGVWYKVYGCTIWYSTRSMVFEISVYCTFAF